MGRDNEKLDRTMIPYDAMGDYSAFLKANVAKKQHPDKECRQKNEQIHK